MKDLYDFSSAKRGAVAPSKGKTRITIMLDDTVLEAARQRADEEGMGYQTLINRLLKDALCEPGASSQQATLSDILATLVTLTEGQEALLAQHTDKQPSAPLQRYSQQRTAPLEARDATTRKAPEKKPGTKR
ncbi:BrnA antitoxin family protein [Pseudomonas sp. GV071]|jgi:hypothetical protein|uniref:BrnA antitoxin family protein n=1 Tax=Pseudomonas sp. GV071 TaxID=2135754 RepID=UPI000D3C7F1A|nr:BrnA antitoxin family protein [Pseudomonas sp. GV071]PTQ73648.1 BrnA antitoxin of type II toxin-antitoxin system [Pseudomonas sp. GV071]